MAGFYFCRDRFTAPWRRVIDDCHPFFFCLFQIAITNDFTVKDQFQKKPKTLIDSWPTALDN